MNEKLQAQLSQILAQIMVSVGDVKDFSIAQLPDIVQKYIQYGFWMIILWIVVSVLAIIVCVPSLFFIHKVAKRAADDNIYVFMSLPITVIIISAVNVLVNVHSLILLLNAPKIWFIFEIKNLLS